jgi:leucyl/phenylalanyl-tRNA--protein transferase
MSKINFPDPRDVVGDVVYVGGALTTENLLAAYRNGIFPWPYQSWLPWVSPEQRAILEFKNLHTPRSLRKIQKRTSLTFTIDKAFESVINACALVPRVHEDSTWITPQMIRAYIQLHKDGHAHSVETWEGDGLVGGLYGVDSGGAFSGESMFYLKPNASRLALLHLIEHLKSRGAEWLDIQMMTPHLSALGATQISRDAFLEKLKAALSHGLKLF